MKLIALEEHFRHAGVAALYDEVDQALLTPTRVPGLDELGDMRLKVMDEAGIMLQVLSHTKRACRRLPARRRQRRWPVLPTTIWPKP